MVQLSEMRDRMAVKEMHVQLPVQEVTQELIRDLSERVREARRAKPCSMSRPRPRMSR